MERVQFPHDVRLAHTSRPRHKRAQHSHFTYVSRFAHLGRWLQYLEFSDTQAAMVGMFFTIGHMLGGVVGGVVGDRMARASPNHGRIYTAQFSDFLRLPLIFILFKVLPERESGAGAYAIILFLIGLLAPWVSIASNRPILCELVSPRLRGQVFAYQRLIEQFAAATMGAPLVGWLSENVFGYEVFHSASVGEDISERNRANASALGASMLYITLVCWGMCFFLYGLIHFTYPRDRDRASRLLR